VQNAPDVSVVASACLMKEALKLRANVLELPHNQLALNTDDINDIISFICTA
jgi:hypothetical protein